MSRDVGDLGAVFLQPMTTTSSDRKPPNALGPLAVAIATAFALAGAMSGTGNDALDIVLLLAVLTGVVLSTRYSVRTWRKLNEHDFKVAHTPRLLMAALAVGINGLTCLVLAVPVVLLLGMLLGGKGIA
jgi:hypothetical protein